jgi:hypothetical protein
MLQHCTIRHLGAKLAASGFEPAGRVLDPLGVPARDSGAEDPAEIPEVTSEMYKPTKSRRAS